MVHFKNPKTPRDPRKLFSFDILNKYTLHGRKDRISIRESSFLNLIASKCSCILRMECPSILVENDIKLNDLLQMPGLMRMVRPMKRFWKTWMKNSDGSERPGIQRLIENGLETLLQIPVMTLWRKLMLKGTFQTRTIGLLPE